MNDDQGQALDRALRAGTTPDDPELAALADTGKRLQDAFAAKAPRAARERAMFVQGVAAARRGGFFGGIAAPALAAAVLLVGGAILAQGAAPGEGLYPVKKALRTVGLAPSASDEIEDLIDSGRDLLNEARDRAESDPEGAEALAVEAIGDLEAAEELLPELDPEDRGRPAATIARLEDRALALIQRIGAAPVQEGPSPVPTQSPDGDRSGDDNSGPGSGDDSDSSGPGSGDDSDSSGPGSGDDSDSSGPGSGGDSDSSGPGSGGDSDSSGPGSGDDGGSGSSGSGSSGSSGSGGSGSG
jgi:hypothetical protein